MPDWVKPLLMEDGTAWDNVKYLLTFRPFGQWPEAARRAYLEGRLHVLPTPASLVFWGVPRILRLHQEVPLGLQAPLIFAAILLHGVCYDFLFIAGQLYVDDEANERIRGACQGFIAFILWGIGAFVGTMLAGKVLALHTLTGASGPIQHNWRDIWITPAFGASAVLIIFMVFFRDPPNSTSKVRDNSA